MQDRKFDIISVPNLLVLIDCLLSLKRRQVRINIGVYGKNMRDTVKHGNVSPVSWGSFSPLMTGKVVGVELVYSF